MSVWSSQRKLYIILTILVFASLIYSIFVFSSLNKKPSCFDGLMNGSEIGVDCGGLCEKVCAEETKNLFDVWTRVFPLSDGVYSAVAYVENQNRDKYVPSVQYEVWVYDKDNNPITRNSQRTNILPNGITPIFIPYIVTDQAVATSASFRFTEKPIFEDYRKYFPPQYNPKNLVFSVSNIELNTPPSATPSASATVKNVSDFTVDNVDFVAIVYDEDDSAIAASKTVEEFVLKGETRLVQFTWVQPFTLNIGNCIVGKCYKKASRVEIIPILKTK